MCWNTYRSFVLNRAAGCHSGVTNTLAQSSKRTLISSKVTCSVAWWCRSHTAVCVRGNVFRSDAIQRGTTCAHSSISITITAGVFQRAPSSASELKDPHRKPNRNHKACHFQSLLLKLDCLNTIVNVVAYLASFLLLSIFCLCMVLSTVTERLGMFSNNWFHNECTTWRCRKGETSLKICNI